MPGPNDRLDQVSREALIQQTANDRVDLVAREALIGQTANDRLDLVAREALIQQTANARLSMVVRECWVPISLTIKLLQTVTVVGRKHKHRKHRGQVARVPAGTRRQPWVFVSC